MVDLSEMAGKAGYYGTRYALIRESRIFREPCGGAGKQKQQSREGNSEKIEND